MEEIKFFMKIAGFLIAVVLLCIFLTILVVAGSEFIRYLFPNIKNN
jgi:hypothetical protein